MTEYNLDEKILTKFMFISERQVEHIMEHYHIYLLRSGRINMCGLNENNLDYVAKAIHETVVQFSSA